MMMRKISIIAAACATLSLGVLSTAAMAAELVPVKVAALRSIAASPIVIAKAKGYFEEAGLDVEIVNFKNTATMVAPLSAGQIDVAAGAPTLGFYNAKLNGLKMKLVADLGRNSSGHGFNAIVVRKDLYDDGKLPVQISNTESRSFLEDGDTVFLSAWCERDGYRTIGFGECNGTIISAAEPVDSKEGG